MRVLLLALFFLSAPYLCAANISVTVCLHNENFNVSHAAPYHVLIIYGETEESMFIPKAKQTVYKRFSLSSGDFFKAVLGTTGYYPFVLGSFGSLTQRDAENIFLHINLQSSGERDPLCPIILGTSVFTDIDGNKLQ